MCGVNKKLTRGVLYLCRRQMKEKKTTREKMG